MQIDKYASPVTVPLSVLLPWLGLGEGKQWDFLIAQETHTRTCMELVSAPGLHQYVDVMAGSWSAIEYSADMRLCRGNRMHCF